MEVWRGQAFHRGREPPGSRGKRHMKLALRTWTAPLHSCKTNEKRQRSEPFEHSQELKLVMSPPCKKTNSNKEYNLFWLGCSCLEQKKNGHLASPSYFFRSWIETWSLPQTPHQTEQGGSSVMLWESHQPSDKRRTRFSCTLSPWTLPKLQDSKSPAQVQQAWSSKCCHCHLAPLPIPPAASSSWRKTGLQKQTLLLPY